MTAIAGSNLGGRVIPEEIDEGLIVLGWSHQAFADAIKLDLRNARRIIIGKFEMPESMAAWFRDLVAYHRAHPCPQDWRGKLGRVAG